MEKHTAESAGCSQLSTMTGIQLTHILVLTNSSPVVETDLRPKVGDMVIATLDKARFYPMQFPGLVLECKGGDCLILWSTESMPVGWFRADQLEVVSASR